MVVRSLGQHEASFQQRVLEHVSNLFVTLPIWNFDWYTISIWNFAWIRTVFTKRIVELRLLDFPIMFEHA